MKIRTRTVTNDKKKAKDVTLDPRWGEPSHFHDPYVLSGFKPRKTDVLITTAPKAGTTWMQQILYQLKSGGDNSYSNIFNEVPWLEFPEDGFTTEQRLACFESMPDPRVFKTHCTYQQTPGLDTVNIVLSSRDPRDCCVSFYHHIMSMTEEARNHHGIQAPLSFDDYFEEWMEFASWFRNVESWWPHKNDSNVLWLRYEDMIADLERCIDRLLDFLGWNLSIKQKKDAMEHCSFAWMKKNSDKFIPRFKNGNPMFQPGGFIRKGKTGDHVNMISPQQEKRIISRAKDILPADCLSFLGID